jgi:hypothetical protein
MLEKEQWLGSKASLADILPLAMKFTFPLL